MNIMIMGAGAIGSLIGGLLSQHNNVLLIARRMHVQAIHNNSLHITGKTHKTCHLQAQETPTDPPVPLDLVILTVKSYDTKHAAQQLNKTVPPTTPILSLQNGLTNIETLQQILPNHDILAATTTHGALLKKPGVIKHTGYGNTILGELNGKKTKRIKNIAAAFNQAGITTQISTHIQKEIWTKAVINASINPVTALFHQKNGYLLKNPILTKIVDAICTESTTIANTQNFNLKKQDMIQKTHQVLKDTAENYSSMYQSLEKQGKTEIESITGKLLQEGKNHRVNTSYTTILYDMIQYLCSCKRNDY